VSNTANGFHSYALNVVRGGSLYAWEIVASARCPAILSTETRSSSGTASFTFSPSAAESGRLGKQRTVSFDKLGVGGRSVIQLKDAQASW